MFTKIDKLDAVIDNLVLYSSFNIIIIAKEERYIQRVLNYLLRVSPYKFEVINIDHPDKLIKLFTKKNRFIGVIPAKSPEEFEILVENYLTESLTKYNYDYNKVDVETVKTSLPNVINRLNARYLYIDDITNNEIEKKERSNE